jgi:hypothetical protein
MALTKNFPIKEGIVVQIRGEAYNVFNHPSFGGTKGVDATAVFDVILGCKNPRRLET